MRVFARVLVSIGSALFVLKTINGQVRRARAKHSTARGNRLSLRRRRFGLPIGGTVIKTDTFLWS
jgi:hypothetical protein